MIDAFALLDQPRRPWLDPEQVKQAFHAKALRSHPDAQPKSGDAGRFAELNEAHQILQDPKRRIQHLLSLSGHAPDRKAATVPKQIEELFPLVAAATQTATAVAQQCGEATNALSRSLLKPQLLQAIAGLERTRGKLDLFHQQAIARLQELDRTWETGARGVVADLQDTYLKLSYLTRWMAELDEYALQLSSC
jgi:curved DNA-binding protein CbpA